MKTRNTITKLITITMAVAAMAAAGLLCGAGWLRPVEAQSGDGSVRFLSYASIGIAHGQRLSYSFFNPNEEGSQPVRAQAYIYDATGRLLTQTDPVELRPGQSHTFNIDRDDLRVAGEPGTGRLQVGVGIRLRSLDGGSTWPNNVHTSMELVNTLTGATTIYQGDYFTGSVTVSGD